MTVQEKTTEIGGGADLAQSWYDNARKENGTIDGVWDCTKVTGIIPADDDQRGSTQNNYYYCSKDHDNTIVEGSTMAELETSAKAWINAQPYTEKPVEMVLTEKS